MHPSPSAFEIDRIPAHAPVEEFEARHYLSQWPAVVTGVTEAWAAPRRWTPDYLRERIAGSSEIEEAHYWFDLGDGLLVEDFSVPELLTGLRARHALVMRPKNKRLWISSRGTRTLWHYDGNSIQTLNVQVRGRKRFTLVSPRTPLPTVSFLFVGTHGYGEPPARLLEDAIWTRFVLEEGEMAFIPQHWFHYVESLDACNINVNWVWTDPDLLTCATARGSARERECIALAYPIAAAARRLGASMRLVEYVESYGGVTDFRVARELFGSTPKWALLTRLVSELSRLPAGIFAMARALREEPKINGGLPRSANDFFEKRMSD